MSEGAGPTLNPVQAIQNLTNFDKPAARVINIAIAGVAAIALVRSWSLFGQDSWTIGLVLVGAYLVISLLSAMPNLILKMLSWVVFLLLVAYAICMFLKFLFPAQVFPGLSGYCFVQPWAQTCPFHADGAGPDIEDTRGDVIARSSPVVEALPGTRPGPASTVSWVSINHYRPWSEVQAMALATQLMSIGWNVQGLADGLEEVPYASGVLEVRYGHGDDATDALRVAVALGTFLDREPLPVVSLVGTQWESEKPGHLQVWLGRAAPPSGSG